MIDGVVEALTRDVVDSLLSQDERRLSLALTAVPVEHIAEAIDLALSISRIILEDLHDQQPSAERLSFFADE